MQNKFRFKLWLWAITSALAGFLFGFDTVVISGAEKQIQDIWSLSSVMHGVALSSALWGTVLGALIGGIPTSKWGRKATLIFNGYLYFISAVGSGIAWDCLSFAFFRFIGGVGIGISTVVAPSFISEISPADDRGKLTSLFQFNIVLGILVAYFSNFILGKAFPVETAWRWMLAAEALPALIYTAMCYILPQSPRWLIVEKGRIEEGTEIFRQINPDLDEAQIQGMVQEVLASKKEVKAQTPFWSWKLRRPILFAFLVAAFNQLSGINIILYFAPRLLGLAGMENPLAAAIALGIANLIFTAPGVALIDRLGRRALLIIGCIGYILSLGILCWAFCHYVEFKTLSSSIDLISAAEQVQRLPGQHRNAADSLQIRQKYETAVQNFEQTPGVGKTLPDRNAAPEVWKQAALSAKQTAADQIGWISFLILGCMLVFIGSHAVGSGAIIWVFISEIFPNEHRANGAAIGCSTHWVFAALLTFLFPIFISCFAPGVIFGFFCGMMILQLLWAIFIMPETKGKTLEALSAELLK